VHAQRTTENAVTQSGDAFGKSVGSEKTGLYNSEDVRGFNPIDAGNARIEGLYFDQLDRIPTRLTKGNTIRVGISAQRYLFPAPTGIVDNGLTFPGDQAQASIEIERGPFGGFAGSIEVEIPLSDRLGISGGVGARNQVRPEGGRNRFRNFGLLAMWQPFEGALIAPFGGGYFNAEDEARPVMFPAGTALPPRIPHDRFLGQDWAARDNVSRTYGLVSKLPLGWLTVEAGLFRSSRDAGNAFADILAGVTPDGRAANRIIIADGNNYDRSDSGEFRLLRDWGSGDIRQRLALSVRGRDKLRLFGGTQRIVLGPSSAIAPDPRPVPPVVLGGEDRDHVRQFTYGASYGLNWAERGSFDVSLSQSRYRKDIDFAAPLRADLAIRDNPWLLSATGSFFLTRRLALYGGYVRGLEEAPIAPDVASNRNEAPPAIRTEQKEIGLRYAITPKLTMVAGLFSIKKPYFNLDPAIRFRELGSVDNRGLEVSLAGQLTPGITLIAGTVLLDPTISGEAVTNRQIGKRPVGSVDRRSILNLDWRLDGGKGPWSFDLALESLSARIGNAANTLEAGARENLSLGLRYRFSVASYKALLRLQVTNVLDDYGWLVSSSGGFTAAPGRTWTAQLVADF
jgi:iron complex outermembrane receptor protein